LYFSKTTKAQEPDVHRSEINLLRFNNLRAPPPMWHDDWYRRPTAKEKS
jgi:hypothetical protein